MLFIKKNHCLFRFGGATFGETLFQLPDLNMSDFALASSIGVRRNVKVRFSIYFAHIKSRSRDILLSPEIFMERFCC